MRVCSVEGCGGEHKARGFCAMHYRRWSINGSADIVKLYRSQTGLCVVDGCGRKHDSKGFCSTHNKRFLKHGDPLKGAKVKNVCNVPNCERYRFSLGFCGIHYWRYRKYGDPLGGRKFLNGEMSQWVLDNLSYKGDECLMHPISDGGGYWKVTILDEQVKAHVVVCTIINGPRPSSDHEAAHSCGNGHLGCVSPMHLRWATRSENQMDKVAHDTHKRGERSHLAKLTESKILEIVDLFKQGLDNKSIAKKYGVTRSAIYEIRNGHNWQWLTGLGSQYSDECSIPAFKR